MPKKREKTTLPKKTLFQEIEEISNEDTAAWFMSEKGLRQLAKLKANNANSYWSTLYKEVKAPSNVTVSKKICMISSKSSIYKKYLREACPEHKEKPVSRNENRRKKRKSLPKIPLIHTQTSKLKEYGNKNVSDEILQKDDEEEEEEDIVTEENTIADGYNNEIFYNDTAYEEENEEKDKDIIPLKRKSGVLTTNLQTTPVTKRLKTENSIPADIGFSSTKKSGVVFMPKKIEFDTGDISDDNFEVVMELKMPGEEQVEALLNIEENKEKLSKLDVTEKSIFRLDPNNNESYKNRTLRLKNVVMKVNLNDMMPPGVMIDPQRYESFGNENFMAIGFKQKEEMTFEKKKL